jgi:hypothetical protein
MNFKLSMYKELLVKSANFINKKFILSYIWQRTKKSKCFWLYLHYCKATISLFDNCKTFKRKFNIFHCPKARSTLSLCIAYLFIYFHPFSCRVKIKATSPLSFVLARDYINCLTRCNNSTWRLSPFGKIRGEGSRAGEWQDKACWRKETRAEHLG